MGWVRSFFPEKRHTAPCFQKLDMAMGQKPVIPVNLPISTKIDQNGWCTPQNGTIGFDKRNIFEKLSVLPWLLLVVFVFNLLTCEPFEPRQAHWRQTRKSLDVFVGSKIKPG